MTWVNYMKFRFHCPLMKLHCYPVMLICLCIICIAGMQLGAAETPEACKAKSFYCLVLYKKTVCHPLYYNILLLDTSSDLWIQRSFLCPSHAGMKKKKGVMVPLTKPS